MRLLTKLTSTLAVLLLCSGAANAAVVGWGAATDNSTASNCPNNGLCTTANNGNFAYNDDGGEGQSSASSNETTYGTSRAQSTLSGTTFTPNLKAYARAANGGGAFASAVGIQGYSYSGADTTLSLDLNLSASINDGSQGEAYAFAQVAVIFTDQLDFFTDYATVVFEVAPSGSVRARSGNDLRITSDSSTSTGTLSLSFDVLDGEDFLVWTGLQAKAWRGAEADAFSTLTMMFDDPTGLTAASMPVVGAVPLPAGAWLFFTGIAAVAGLARRKKQALAG